MEALEQAQIGVIETRSMEVVAALVAQRPIRRMAEGVRIKPIVGLIAGGWCRRGFGVYRSAGIVHGHAAAADVLRRIRTAIVADRGSIAEQRSVGAVENGYRKTRLEGGDTRNRPAIHYAVHNPVVVESSRQLPIVAGDKPVARVKR